MSKQKGVLKLASASLTRKEKLAQGKLLRDKIARTDHAGWQTSIIRPDPINTLIQSSEGRDESLLPIRYGRMLASPFAFFRGAASIMAADLANTPRTNVIVQACGDCHLVNFGGFATPERRIAFDINDFDETLPAPWEWDVKRLAASFVIASENNKHSQTDGKEAVLECVAAYREWMMEFSTMSILDRWYYLIDVEKVMLVMKDKDWKKTLGDRITAEKAKSSGDKAFPKLAEIVDGKAIIKDVPPLIYHMPALKDATTYKTFVTDVFMRYRETLPDDRKVLLDHYELHDVAMKVVGVGSVGTRCAVMLMMSGTNEPLFLQVKEARISVMEPFIGASAYANRGQRVVVGQRIMQSASDMFLGWTENSIGKHFYVRQLRDTKIKPLVEEFTPERMKAYARMCGYALARAHAKAGNPAVLAGYMGTNAKFDEAIADFAVAYSKQNEADYDALKKAVKNGKLQAVFEEGD
jgi:uncharacterized protein (DUF2252 family)